MIPAAIGCRTRAYVKPRMMELEMLPPFEKTPTISSVFVDQQIVSAPPGPHLSLYKNETMSPGLLTRIVT